MKIRSIIALAFTLTWSACSSAGSGNDAAMIAAVNADKAAHPVCAPMLHKELNGTTSIGNPNGTPLGGAFLYAPQASRDATATPAWEPAFVRAGLLRRKPVGGDVQHDPGAYTLQLSSLQPSRYNNLCFGHAVADSIAKTEPISASYVAYGYSKDAVIVEFRSHFAYADWAHDPAVQSAIWNDMLGAKEKDAIAPSFNAILYNDAVKGWQVYSSGQ
jgi:hypothetical protein